MSNYKNFPKNGIGFHEKEKLSSWLNTYSDPDLWHQMVHEMNYDLPFTMEYVIWIVQQPECDIATAVSALSLTHVYECIYSEPYSDDEQEFVLAKIICEKSERGEFMRSEIGGVESTLDLPPTELLGEIKSGCNKYLSEDQSPYLPIPYFILSTEFSTLYERTPYYIDETAIVRIDSLDERARMILDSL